MLAIVEFCSFESKNNNLLFMIEKIKTQGKIRISLGFGLVQNTTGLDTQRYKIHSGFYIACYSTNVGASNAGRVGVLCRIETRFLFYNP